MFSPLHDNHFETDEKFCTELINLLLIESSFWRKLYLVSLFFINYRVIQFRYFWWHYFFNNFSLLDGLSRLVCLLMVYSYFIFDQYNIHFLIRHVLQQFFILLSHAASIYFFFWTPFLLFTQTFLRPSLSVLESSDVL